MQLQSGAMLAVLFSATMFSSAKAQDTMYIKDASAKLLPGTRKFMQYTETKEGLVSFNALLTRTVQRTSYQGTPAFLIIQTYQSEKSIDIDSSYCQLNTLLPLAYLTDIPAEQHKERVFFSQDRIENTILYKDSTQRFTKVNKAFYSGVTTDDLIASLPLAGNKQFLLKTVNPGMRYFEYLTTVLVEGQETITLPGQQPVQCWRLQVNMGGSISTQWYTVKGQQQLKIRYLRKNGSSFVRIATIG